MFRPDDIQARLRERPFRPFRIIAAEGLRYEVRHPDLVMVGVRDVLIGHPTADNPTVYDSVTHLALVHIVALELLDAAPAQGNGQG